MAEEKDGVIFAVMADAGSKAVASMVDALLASDVFSGSDKVGSMFCKGSSFSSSWTISSSGSFSIMSVRGVDEGV